MRMARRAKAYAAGTLDLDDEGDDIDDERDEPPKKPAARRGRPPKAAKAKAEDDTGQEAKKKPARRTTKKTVESPKKVSKTKVTDKGAEKTKKQKTEQKILVYQDIGGSDDDSELTERFDFDTDEENAPDEVGGETSDPERQAAFFAAAEGSLEMQANDIDISPLNSPVSTSPKGPPASPTKRRRKLSAGVDDDDSLPDLLVGMKGISTKAGSKASISSGQRPAASGIDQLERLGHQ